MKTTARSIAFSSSRTLPGQSYEVSASIASSVNSSIGLLFLSAYSFRKCKASIWMSLFTLPQRWDADVNDVQAIEQVFPESLLLDLAMKIFVRSCKNTDVRIDSPGSAKSFEFSIL